MSPLCLAGVPSSGDPPGFAGVERLDRWEMNQHNNPLHGLTLQMIVEALVDHYGYAELGSKIPVRCFTNEPSVKSSLKFLRRTPWAREKVEQLYLATFRSS